MNSRETRTLYRDRPGLPLVRICGAYVVCGNGTLLLILAGIAEAAPCAPGESW
jgi:hypothetical protein